MKRDLAAVTGTRRLEIVRWIAGGELLAKQLIGRRGGGAARPPLAAELERLIGEAKDLSDRARDPGSRIPARDVEDWLHRAEAAVRTARTRGEISDNATALDRLKQLRCLIDAANVAIMTGSRSHDAWPRFRALTDRGESEMSHRRTIQGPNRV